MPHGVMFVLPVFGEGDLQRDEEALSRISGFRISTLVITELLVGTFCYRKYDCTYTKQYKTLVEKYNAIKPEQKIDYTNL